MRLAEMVTKNTEKYKRWKITKKVFLLKFIICLLYVLIIYFIYPPVFLSSTSPCEYLHLFPNLQLPRLKVLQIFLVPV